MKRFIAAFALSLSILPLMAGHASAHTGHHSCHHHRHGCAKAHTTACHAAHHRHHHHHACRAHGQHHGLKYKVCNEKCTYYGVVKKCSRTCD